MEVAGDVVHRASERAVPQADRVGADVAGGLRGRRGPQARAERARRPRQRRPEPVVEEPVPRVLVVEEEMRRPGVPAGSAPVGRGVPGVAAGRCNLVVTVVSGPVVAAAQEPSGPE